MDAAHDWIRHHSRYAGTCLRLAFNAPLTDFGRSGLGLLVTVVSFFQFSKLLSGNPSPFALCYTIGNILSLGATMFLVGNYRYSLWLFVFCSRLRVQGLSSKSSRCLQRNDGSQHACTHAHRPTTAFHDTYSLCSPYRYLFFLILTIILATVKSDSFTSGARVASVVVCLVFQMLALAWYVLSYIPFGRDMVKKCLGC